MKKIKENGKRMLAFLLAVITLLGTGILNQVPVYAASGTLTFNSGETIAYGDYFTTRMTFDGEDKAYCVEPLKPTPSAGTYEYDLLGNDSPVRKALYYLPGGYGYEKHIKNQYLGGWAEDDAYVIGHLVVSYIYAGYSAGSGAFYGAPQSYIDKALEVNAAIGSLSNPPESFRAFLVPGSGRQTITGSWYQKPYGWIELKKSSVNEGISSGNENYSLAGAEYGVYLGDQQVDTLITDENGYAKSKELEEASYTLRELKASKGYAIDVSSYAVNVQPEITATAAVYEVPQNNPMNLLLQKLDAETAEANAQGAASLAGAEFTVKYYTVQSDADPAASGLTPERTWVFTTDAEGKIQFSKEYQVSGDELYYQSDGKTPCIPLGTVTVQESKAPNGYFIEESVHVQKILSDGNQETVSLYNAPEVKEQIYRGGAKVQKRDLETGKAEPQGNAALKDAEFTITTLNAKPVLVNGKIYTENQVVMTLVTDEKGVASTEKDTLPFGHYRIDETQAPEGYLNEGRISIEFDITTNGEIVDLTSEELAISNQIVRGDLELVKVSDGDLNRLANVPFAITSKTTGESHVMVTDKNGYASTASSWNKHTTNTNAGKSSTDGIWFGEGQPDDSKGALYYDTYHIKEQRCSSNEGMNLLEFEVTVYKNAVTIDLGTLTDDRIEITTSAKDDKTGGHMSKPEEKVTLIDTVEYEGLKKGQEYRLVGTLMNQENGEPHTIAGKKVTAETTFKAKKSSGTVEVTFVFDGSDLGGKTVVVFEELYHDKIKLAAHADIIDKDQTIYFPKIKTTAKDSETNTKISNPDSKVTLLDMVSYENLIPGKEYKVSGTLMDKESKKPLEVDGKPVTSEAIFTPKESKGSIELAFEFDGSELAGKTTVVFESLTYKEKEIAVHADIEDEAQTIMFPKLKTTAKDGADGDQEVMESSKVTIVDTVSYENLIPGKTYHATGILMDKTTGAELIVNGATVTAETVFKAEQSKGSVEVEFVFDASELANHELVVFESLFYVDGEKDVLISEHKDINDKGQTVKVVEKEVSPTTPEVKTTHGPKTGDKSQVLVFIALLFLSGGAAIGVARKWKKRRNVHKEI